MSGDTTWINEIEARFTQKLDRVTGLHAAAMMLEDLPDEASSAVADDVLRAAVVLHAAVEDLVREAERSRLLDGGDTDMLKTIPFPVGRHGQSEITLHTLARKYPQMAVKEVVGACVNAWLDRKSYGHLGALTEALDRLGVGYKEALGTDGNLLAAMISRRHRIAHYADHNRGVGGEDSLQVLDREEFASWVVATRGFANRFLDSLKTMNRETSDVEA